eukprot:tig00000342_g24214.t1
MGNASVHDSAFGPALPAGPDVGGVPGERASSSTALRRSVLQATPRPWVSALRTPPYGQSMHIQGDSRDSSRMQIGLDEQIRSEREIRRGEEIEDLLSQMQMRTMALSISDSRMSSACDGMARTSSKPVPHRLQIREVPEDTYRGPSSSTPQPPTYAEIVSGAPRPTGTMLSSHSSQPVVYLKNVEGLPVSLQEALEEDIEQHLQERLTMKELARAWFFRKRPLSVEEEERVKKEMRGASEAVIVEHSFPILGLIEVKRRHLQTLNGTAWLNDEIINFYMGLLARRNTQANPPLPLKCHLWHSLFYTRFTQPSYNYKNVQRWTRNKVDIFSMDRVICPINVNNTHWTLAVINIKEKQFEYYDGYYGDGADAFRNLRRWLQDEHKDKKNADLDLSQWRNVSPSSSRVPSQTDGNSCGVFACMFADYASTGDEGLMVGGGPDAFSQGDMQYFRRRIALEIIQAQAFSERAS